jgi:glycine dehydrogenase subunit 1
MAKDKRFVHPYIPNSAPGVLEEMLEEIGVRDVEALYAEVPRALRLKRVLDLPEPLPSEHDLKRHAMGILSRNSSCDETLSFLGAGCWQHFIPAVCDEINGRSEFKTVYTGSPYANLGKFQAYFEFQSQVGELVGMDVVGFATHSWGTAAGNAVRMASRKTGRNEVLIPRTISPERLATIKTFCQREGTRGHIRLTFVDYDRARGLLDLKDLRAKISSATAAVYIENPSYLGFIESQGAAISEMAHAHGSVSIVGVDPISLGVLAAPADYGADIVVGTAQPLGIHMNAGGGAIGFVACRDEPDYVAEHPSYLISITDTSQEGEYGFDQCFFSRTSMAAREKGKDWVGTGNGLWMITASVYLALMGPEGLREVGEAIIQRSHYAMELLSELKGVRILLGAHAFKEFIVNFDDAGKSVAEINTALLQRGIFGGKDISKELPELGNSALYCVTEVHNQRDIQRLAASLKEVLG